MPTLHQLRIALEASRARGGPIKTVKDFARAHDVAADSVYRVCDGRMTSARLDQAINAFIDAHRPYVAEHFVLARPNEAA